MILLLAFVLLDPNQTLQILSLVPSNRKVFRSRPIILVLTSHKVTRLTEHILMLPLCKTLLKVQSLASTVNSRICRLIVKDFSLFHLLIVVLFVSRKCCVSDVCGMVILAVSVNDV